MNDTIKNLHEALMSEQDKWVEENVFLEYGNEVSVTKLGKVYRGQITDMFWHNGRFRITIMNIGYGRVDFEFDYFKEANDKAKKEGQNELKK